MNTRIYREGSSTEQPQTPQSAPQPPNERPQKVATPAFLHQRLLSFRVGIGARQSYVLRDNVRGSSYDFQPWQFFLLEVLPGCTDDVQLASVFQDRFGHPLLPQERDFFLASIADAGLFNEAAGSHPLLARFCKKTYDVEGEQARPKSHRTVVVEQSQHAAGAAAAGAAAAAVPAPSAVRPDPAKGKIPDEDETLPAGMQDATDFDARRSKWMWVLFNPTWILKITVPLLAPLRILVFALPLLLLGAFNVAVRYAPLLEEDMARLLTGFGLVEHWLLSLLTVNLLVTWTTAVVAFRYRATVSGFGIAFVMGFYPRFTTRMAHLDQLSRVERMWLHGAPLLTRLFLFCIGLYAWFATAGLDEHVPTAALAITVTSAASFLFSANPLVKSNGYHLLSAFTNEPHLRGKAFRALLNKMRGGTFKEANELLLATYAITMAAFMFVLCVGAATFIAFALHQMYLGGSAIIVATVVGFLLLRRVLNYFGKVEAAYERSLQFDRWRKRTLGDEEARSQAPAPGFATYVWRAGLLILFVALFLPYSYEAGGSFVIHPKLQQVITTDLSGRIEAVYYEGGETVPKGSVVAKLACTEDQAQAKIIDQKMIEQRAVIDHLKSLPREEEVQLARQQVEVEETRVKFSRIEVERTRKLADQGFAPAEELDEARRQLDVDLEQLSEKRAALQVAKLGPTEHEVAAAEAKYDSLEAERAAFLDRIRRCDLVMPFDGRLLTQYLKEKGNSYYKSGDVFAEAESSGSMTAEIEVPESEAEYLVLGAVVEFKPIAHSDEVFTGTVVHVDADITERTFGNVIKVIAAVHDEDGKLKNGMTGYSKIDGPTLPVWEAYSRQMLRFVQVHVWSWIP